MSREATEARAVQREADRDWRIHKASCAMCTLAQSSKKLHLRCAAGADLANEAYRARQETARNVALDAAPVPGQAALFTEAECGQAPAS